MSSPYYPAGTDRLPGEEVMVCDQCGDDCDPLSTFNNADKWVVVDDKDICPRCFEDMDVAELEDDE